MGAQDGHLDSHTAPELWVSLNIIMFVLDAESDNTDTAAVNSDDTGGTDRPDPQGPPAPVQPAPPFRVGGDQSGANLSKDESESLHYSRYMYL